MPKYKIEIREIIRKEVWVDAQNYEEAEQLAIEQHNTLEDGTPEKYSLEADWMATLYDDPHKAVCRGCNADFIPALSSVCPECGANDYDTLASLKVST